jgi:hypothetical protein
MTDRRYDDDEAAEIFRKAAEGPQSLPSQAAGEQGMTLAELQDIAREAGISPDAVASAARALEIQPRAGGRTFLGLPIGVERSVALSRKLSDDEWERLVVQLREVFHARGNVSTTGSFRQWTNGNLQVLLEPTASGQRLRISTVRGNAIASMSIGAAMLGLGIVMAIAATISGHLAEATMGIAILTGGGAAALANGALRIPGWARLRARQMEGITTQLAIETGSDVPDDKAST